MLSGIGTVLGFLPTPSHGGRRDQNRTIPDPRDFYPRPHMEGDFYLDLVSGTLKIFLPTPSHGGRRSNGLDIIAELQFLPTPSHGGRPARCLPLKTVLSYFYPRPHMEGDQRVKYSLALRQNFYPRPHMEGDRTPNLQCHSRYRISTHALTWRATSVGFSFATRARFLPTPSHGGRQRQWSFPLPLSNFYPRPHMEGDRRLHGRWRGCQMISTHALTWRATFLFLLV